MGDGPWNYFAQIGWSLTVLAGVSVVHLGIHLWRMFRR